MGRSLMTFASRASRNIAATVFVAGALVLLNWLYDLSLRDASFFSGWMLTVGTALLAVYNTRKKLPFLPLLSSAMWLQIHIYVGWLVIVLFLLHTAFRPPSGTLEILLWLLFVMVVGSGLLGLALSRILPTRLRHHGERIIFERIPVFRAQLAREVEELAMRSIDETSSNTIAQFYGTQLQPFFHSHHNFFRHLVGSNEALERMSQQMASLRRYLDKEGKEILDEIEWRVVAKNNLDYQYALQWLLKGWLFVHIPLTYSLLVIAIVHVIMVYGFSGGTL